MNKTITIQSYNRPEHLRKCLDHIVKMDGLSDWKIYGFVDGGGDPECQQILLNSSIVDYSTFHTTNMGIREANKWTLEYIFEEIGSELNLHIEEDVIVSKNSLNLINQIAESVQKDIYCGSLYSYPQLNKQSNKIHKFKGFSCWGWFATKGFYEIVIRKALNRSEFYYDDSWATSVYDYMVSNRINQFIPEMSHAKNIGIEDGVHSGVNNKRLDIQDRWTGGRFESVDEYDICEERCNTCRRMDEVR